MKLLIIMGFGVFLATSLYAQNNSNKTEKLKQFVAKDYYTEVKPKDKRRKENRIESSSSTRYILPSCKANSQYATPDCSYKANTTVYKDQNGDRYYINSLGNKTYLESNSEAKAYTYVTPNETYSSHGRKSVRTHLYQSNEK